MSETPAGWYPDYSIRDWERYWDGAAWTSQVRPAASNSTSKPGPPSLFSADALREADKPRVAPPQHEPTRVDETWGSLLFNRQPNSTPPKKPGGGMIGAAMRRADEEREAHKKIVCQFCQETGHVTVQRFKKDKRLSATRTLTGMATLGASAMVVGVTKKGWVTRLSCSNCGMTWDV